MDKPEPPKIVKLPHTGPGQQLPQQFVQLLTDCRKQTQEFVAPLVEGLFGLVDDRLFNCADDAHSNSEQSVYFEAMRTLRLERSAIERRLQCALAERFNHFIEQRPDAELDLEHLDIKNLSLIQRDDYEEVVIVTNLAAHAEGECNEILWALEQRLAVLNRGVKLDHRNNPAAPRALVRSYILGLEPLKLSRPVLRVLHQLFQTEVLKNLNPFYNKLNQHLIQNGILPNLKYSTRGNRSSHQTDQRLSHSEPESEPEASPHDEEPITPNPFYSAPRPPQVSGALHPGASISATPEPQPPPAGEAQAIALDDAQSKNLLHSITQLLGERLHLSLPGDTPFPSVQSYSTATTASTTYSQQDLLQALGALQQQRSEQDQALLAQPLPVVQIKQDLVSQLESTSDQAQAVAERDAETIDLVGMLFDFILDDDELPDQIKALLSHLHTPYLKVALADTRLFEAHDHPARLLLNLLARAACEWSDQPHHSQNIRLRIEGTVERILQEYDDGTALFSELLDEFQHFYKLLEHQSEVLEQRAVEAAQGRDKLVSARLLADREVSQALSEQAYPEALTRFLRGPWTDVLVFSHLRHGPHSPNWRQALDTLNQLCWSVQPKESDTDQNQLRRIQPELIHSLTQLLSQLGGLQPQQIRGQLTPIVALQKAALGLLPEGETPPVAPPCAPALGHEMLVEEELSPRQELSDEISDEESLQLASLDFGCWFKFQEGTTVRRLKLAWYSPTTQNYMFVDSTGNRAAVRSRLELASELKDGRAQITPKQGAPLVDRALKAIQSLLQRFTAGDKA